MAAAMRAQRRRRTTRRDWSFVEFAAIMFVLGLALELLYVSNAPSGGVGWLWLLPGIAALIGFVLLAAREPTNL